MFKRYVFLLMLLTAACLACLAQTPTTQGREFWVSYMRNGHRGGNSNPGYDRISLIVSAKEDCSITISNEYTQYFYTFNVNAGEVSLELVPDGSAYNSQKDGSANTGLHVVATKEISLYIANEAENSYDASNVLPVSALGTNYLIQSYDSKKINNEGSGTNTYSTEVRATLLVVAVEDNTVVDIIPSAVTDNDHAVGNSYSIELDRGQVYHAMTKNGSVDNTDGDFSGTIVTSNKPIAVFNGNCLAAVPGGGNVTAGYDHVFEQAMPTSYWGKRFVVTSTRCPNNMDLGDDEVKVTALTDNTVVTKNGNPLFSLNAGQSNSFTMSLDNEPCAYLESNNPIAVYLYNHSHGTGSGTQYGDPSMVWISPVEQTLEDITFSTFSVQQVQYHFVNIVCYSDYVSEMTCDGVNIASEFVPVPGNNDFSYTRYPISHDVHTLHCPGGFVAHVYGIGVQEGYAYSVGSSAKSLTNVLYVDGVISTELPDDFFVCQNDEVSFRVEANYDDIDHVAWDFGDNTQGTGQEVTHVFSTSGQMEITSVIYRYMNGSVQPFDTMSVSFLVKPVPNNPETFHSSCVSWWWWGIECTETATYSTSQGNIHFNTPEGCVYDSIMHFTLEPPEESFDTVTACNSYTWETGVLTVPGDYNQVVVDYSNGCRTIAHLHLNLYYSPSLHINGLSNVAVATNLWPGEYYYYLEDSLSLDISSIEWKLSDNEDNSWVFRPHGASCTIVTYSMDTKLLSVSGLDGDCLSTDTIVIHCSGYSVGEHEALPLEVFPNPAKDEMIVKGKDMVEILIYNLLGQPVKCTNAQGNDLARLDVGELPQGLYLLESRTKYGNITRLISVIK